VTSRYAQWRDSIGDYVKNDWRENPFRFCLEMTGWAISIGCSVTYAWTVPNLPFIPLYTAFITGCLIMAWCAYTRGSFGILGNYLLLSIIDSIGLIKLIIQQS